MEEITNRAEALELVQRGFKGGLLYVSDELRADREIVLAAVKHDGWMLQYASKPLRADREIVTAAVRNEGLALQYASKPLRADREIVTAAVNRAGLAFRYAIPALRNDAGIALAAVNNFVSTGGMAWILLKYAGEDLLARLQAVQAAGVASGFGGELLQYLVDQQAEHDDLTARAFEAAAKTQAIPQEDPETTELMERVRAAQSQLDQQRETLASTQHTAAQVEQWQRTQPPADMPTPEPARRHTARRSL